MTKPCDSVFAKNGQSASQKLVEKARASECIEHDPCEDVPTSDYSHTPSSQGAPWYNAAPPWAAVRERSPPGLLTKWLQAHICRMILQNRRVAFTGHANGRRGQRGGTTREELARSQPPPMLEAQGGLSPLARIAPPDPTGRSLLRSCIEQRQLSVHGEAQQLGRGADSGGHLMLAAGLGRAIISTRAF